MTPELKQQIIDSLQPQIEESIQYNNPMNEKSWGEEYGVLLTINEAQEIIKLLQSN